MSGTVGVMLSLKISNATYTFVRSNSGVFGSGGGTTTGVDTSGANLIVVGIWYHTGFGTATISDSKSNSWTALTAYTNFGQGVKLFYCENPTVDSGHTITTNAGYCGVGMLAVSSTGSITYQTVTGAAANASGNLQPGSITPSVNDSILVTAFGSFNGAAPTTPSGYTSIANNTTGTAEAGGMAYKIQTTASAENPTWNGTGTSQAATMMCFNP